MPDYHVKRCFIAIPLDAAARADMADLMDLIEIDGLRKTSRENLHITLKFLGDVEDPSIPVLIETLGKIAPLFQPIELEMERIEYMPSSRRPRVLGAVMTRPDAVLRLYEQVEEAVFKLGFPRDGRSYTPHVTLGRFKGPQRSLPRLEEIELPPISLPVEKLVLMQSVLDREGPGYASLAQFELGLEKE